MPLGKAVNHDKQLKTNKQTHAAEVKIHIWKKSSKLTALKPPNDPPATRKAVSESVVENRMEYMIKRMVRATETLTRFMRVRSFMFCAVTDCIDSRSMASGGQTDI